MNNPFRPLDALKNRPNPAKKIDVFIEFKGQEKNSDINNQIFDENRKLDEETNKTSENIEKDEKEQEKKMKIIDKRADYDLNRAMIIERLKNKNAFQVPIERKIMSQKTFIPTDINAEKKNEDKIRKKDTSIIIEEKGEEIQDKDESEEQQPDNESEKQIKELETIEKPKIEFQEEPVKKKRGRKKKVDNKIIIQNEDISEFVINDKSMKDRLPKMKPLNIKTSTYYMDNRKLFIQKINQLLKNYYEDIKNDKTKVSCNLEKNPKFNLLTHQKIILDYFNLYTPYRGLLLYHGLGSGKTCSSIALAEGMKNDKQIYIMTPASLKMNFFSELKKCGDELYKKNQFWEFVSIEGKSEYINVLSQALNISTDYIKNNGGAWLVNVNKEPNFTNLSSSDQNNIDEQLNYMIRSKYIDINYNGLNMKILNKYSDNSTRNPFDNSVVIIDEAHNFVSRVVNKIKNKGSISYKLYDYLMSASNARIIFLTGTPIINYPNEIAILYNMLRGYIKTWKFKIPGQRNTYDFIKMFDKHNFKTYDYIDFKENSLIVTRNPYGFINTKKRGVVKGTARIKNKEKNNITKKIGGFGEIFKKYNGVKLDNTGNISDSDFQKTIQEILKSNKIIVTDSDITVELNKCLPDIADEFNNYFIDNDSGSFKNNELFQKRITGLTSYFRSAQEKLLPKIIKTDDNKEYHIIRTEMSKHQFAIYEKIRKIEADKERSNKRNMNKKLDNEDLKISSTYKIFSRAACNFAFPSSINRPQPPKKGSDITEDDINGITVKEKRNTDTYIDEDDEDEKQEEIIDYNKQIENTLKMLDSKNENGESEFLSASKLDTYSPKFSKILDNITDIENSGLHLVYSQFRTIEGIGILRLVLLANGFAEFKIKKIGNQYEIVENKNDYGKPKFVLYTGTETAEEKEIIRNIYNGTWDQGVPSNIVSKLNEMNKNNLNGEIIKVFMITASGAEGINLKNTRFVHIVEPYWHMVRIDQVIGRAKRICSHQDLPAELRTIKIFLYLSTLSAEQKISDKNIELRDRDRSRIDNKTPVTTDETLYEIAFIKNEITNQILHSIKETAIDCELYSQKNKDENIVCYGYGKIESNNFSSYPSFKNDKTEDKYLNLKPVEWVATEIDYKGETYALNEMTNEVFDLDSYKEAVANNGKTQPKYVGMLVEVGDHYEVQ
jgi:hypothetical protein